MEKHHAGEWRPSPVEAPEQRHNTYFWLREVLAQGVR